MNVKPMLPQVLMVLALAFAGGGLWPAVAAAQQGWTDAPLNLATVANPLSSTSAVAMDAAGNAVVAWRGSSPWAPVFARRYSATERSWGEPVAVSDGGVGAPSVVMDAQGNTTVMWEITDPRTPGDRFGVRAAHHSVTTGTWSPPVVVKDYLIDFRCGMLPGSSRMVTDSAGHVLFIWTYRCRVSSFFSSFVNFARYTPATGVVETAFLGSKSGEPLAQADIQVDPYDNAVALWNDEDGIRAAYYDAASGTWSAPVAQFEPASSVVREVKAGVDGTGNVVGTWLLSGSHNAVRAIRFNRATLSWGAVTDVASIPADASLTDLQLAVDRSGQAIAMWKRSDGTTDHLQAAFYPAGRGAWSEPVDVTPTGRQAGSGVVAFDGFGNATAVWYEEDGPRSTVRAARVSAAGVTSLFDLATLDQGGPPLALAVSAGGAATVTWMSLSDTVATLQVMQWRATPAAPSIAAITTGDGALAIAFTPPIASHPAFEPTSYDYSTDDGATWTARAPASTVSPIRIANLTNGVSYAVRLRATNAAGPGAASTSAIGTPAPAPNAPSQLAVSARMGQVVTLNWLPPDAGLPPTGYVLQGGRRAGEVLASLSTGSTLPTVTFAAPTGMFYIRMHAVVGTAWSAPSNEILLSVNLPAPPSAPANLLGLVSGSAAALSWTTTLGGGAPTSLWLNVSGAATATLPLPIAEVFTFPNVPPGTYTLSVIAANASGASPPSNAVTLTFPGPCSGVPDTPINLQAWTVGSTIFLSWNPPVSGPAVTSYTVAVSGAYAGSFTTTGRTFSGSAAPGIYAVNVSASNACGTGPRTPERMVTVQ